MLCLSSMSLLCPWSALTKKDHATSTQCRPAGAMDSPTSLENELPRFLFFGKHFPLHPADFTCVQNFDTNVLLWSLIKLPLPASVEQFARQNKPDQSIIANKGLVPKLHDHEGINQNSYFLVELVDPSSTILRLRFCEASGTEGLTFFLKNAKESNSIKMLFQNLNTGVSHSRAVVGEGLGISDDAASFSLLACIDNNTLKIWSSTCYYSQWPNKELRSR